MENQFWMIATLKPNGTGAAHHTTMAINVHPIKYAMISGNVILFAMSITAHEYRSAKHHSAKVYVDSDFPIIASTIYKIP